MVYNPKGSSNSGDPERSYAEGIQKAKRGRSETTPEQKAAQDQQRQAVESIRQATKALQRDRKKARKEIEV